MLSFLGVELIDWELFKKEDFLLLPENRGNSFFSKQINFIKYNQNTGMHSPHMQI